MRKSFAVSFGVLLLASCRPTLDDASTRALARMGAPGVITRAGLDSVAGPAPDVTQCSDGREVRRYDWGGDTAVVVTLQGRGIIRAAIVLR